MYLHRGQANAKDSDQPFAAVVKDLKSRGLFDDTIVVWTTDNGAYQYMWPEGGTSPFRGDKGTTWEGGMRVPTVVRWPGAPAGRRPLVSDQSDDRGRPLAPRSPARGPGDVTVAVYPGADGEGHPGTSRPCFT